MRRASLAVAAVLLLGGAPQVADAKRSGGKAVLTAPERVARLWSRVDVFYLGNGAPQPTVVFHRSDKLEGGAFALTYPSLGEIHTSPRLTQALRARHPYLRRVTRWVMLWEFGRLIQRKRSNVWLIHKTNSVSRWLNRSRGGS